MPAGIEPLRWKYPFHRKGFFYCYDADVDSNQALGIVDLQKDKKLQPVLLVTLRAWSV